MGNERLIKTLMNESIKGNHNKIYRFLISILSSTPYIGGVFGAVSALWSETEQNKINAVFESALKVSDERCSELENVVISLKDRNWIVAYIRINPKTLTILESSNVSSITDQGNNTFSINFFSELKNGFISQYYGNKEVKLNCIIESNTKIIVSMIPPLPDIITFTFFNLE